MHRSGTSLVAKTLHDAGLFLGEKGDFLPADPDNPDGFFEHQALMQLNDELLAACGGAWDRVPERLPGGAGDPRVAHLRDRAAAALERLRRPAPAWGWKDPRTSLTARFWLDLVPDLRFIVCVRSPLEVALSLKGRDGIPYAESLRLWQAHYAALGEVVPEHRRLVTHYGAHLRNPRAEARRLISFAGLGEAKIGVAVGASKSELHRHRIDINPALAGADRATADLYERLRREAGDPIPPDRLTSFVPSPLVRDALLNLVLEARRRRRHIALLPSLMRERMANRG